MLQPTDRVVDKIYELEAILPDALGELNWREVIPNTHIHFGFLKCAFTPLVSEVSLVCALLLLLLLCC